MKTFEDFLRDAPIGLIELVLYTDGPHPEIALLVQDRSVQNRIIVEATVEGNEVRLSQ